MQHQDLQPALTQHGEMRLRLPGVWQWSTIRTGVVAVLLAHSAGFCQYSLQRIWHAAADGPQHHSRDGS